MRFGLSVTSFYPDVVPRDGARFMIERVQAAQKAGLDCLFVGDHHATSKPYFQNTAVLGRLLAEWQGPVFGALYLLPLIHPVLLAEHTATLANLSDGRFVLQCGLGAGSRQFSAMGVSLSERRERFEESLRVLRALWAGEEVGSTAPWAFSGARISPLPPEMPEIWVGASALPAIERAARIGDGWIASPALEVDAARVQLEQYREACARHGRPSRASIRRDVLVAETQELAEQRARGVLDAGYRGFPSRALIVGAPELAAERILELAELGFEEVLVRNLASEQAVALASIDCLSEVRNLAPGQESTSGQVSKRGAG